MSPVVDHRSERRRSSRWLVLGCVGSLGCLLIAAIVLVALFGAGFITFIRTASLGAPPPAPPSATPKASRVLLQRWSFAIVSGTGLAAGELDGDGKMDVAVSSRSGGVLLNRSGALVRAMPIITTEHVAIGRRPRGGYLIGYGTWTQRLNTANAAGKAMWSYRTSDAVDWAAPVDLGDPRGDGVAVGYNGSGGLHILDPTGKLRTRIGGLGNVWCVAPLRRRQGVPADIACVHAGGTVRVYNVAGTMVREIPASGYQSKLITGDLDGDGTDEILAVGSGANSESVLTAFNAQGKLLWQYTPPGSPGLEPGLIAMGRFMRRGRQVVVGGVDGSLTFLDGQGKTVGSQFVGQNITRIATLPNPAAPRDGLVVLTPIACDYYAAK